MAPILANLLTIFLFMIIARLLLTWFPDSQRHPAVQILNQLVDPILEPLRRLNLRAGQFDFSPIIAILILQVLISRLNSANF